MSRGWYATLAIWLFAGMVAIHPSVAAEPKYLDADRILTVEVPRFSGDVKREHRDLVPYMVWVEDPQGSRDLASARTISQWRVVEGVALRPGVNRSAFWLQFRLTNDSNGLRDVVVHFRNIRQDYMEWFVVNTDGVTQDLGRVGDRLPMSVRAVPTRIMAVPVSLPPGEQRHVYVRITSHDGWNYEFRPQLVSRAAFLADVQREDYWHGILFGATITFAVLGVWGFIATRKRSGLYFAAYAVAGVGFSMSELAYDLAYLWPAHPVWHKHFMLYASLVTAMMYTAFVGSFLDLRNNAPQWVIRLLWVLSALAVVSMVPLVFDRMVLGVYGSRVSMLLILVVSAVAVWLALRRVRGAIFVAAGCSLPGLAIALLVLRHQNLVGNLVVEQILVSQATAFNILLISIGLARSLQFWRVERLQAMFAARRAQEQLQAKDAHEQRHDRLTGLPNRLALDEWLMKRVEDSRPFALLYLGLRGFKDMVDQHGEAAADQALLEVGRRCAALMGANDYLAHTVSDEFVLALHGADATQALSMASVLMSRLDQPVTLDSGTLTLGPRIGIAAWPADAGEPLALRQCAMLALQDAWEAPHGAGAVQCYRQGSDQVRARRNTLLRNLAQAATSGQLQLHYQPKLDVRSRCVQGAEALMRWQHPDLGMVSPVEFIALAERAGRMHELTAWVLAQAVGQIARWRADGLVLDLSVNLSVQDLQHRDLPERLQQLLEDSQVPARALTLEVTETSALHDSDTVRRVLGDLRHLGLSLSIDDFGTGYSSLSTLQSLPLAELKIDRSFVRPLALEDSEERCAAIVRAATDMGHAMGLRVVCEGVETAAVAARLADWGCDELQGYWLSRPMPAERLSVWLRDGGGVRGAMAAMSR